MPRHYGGVECMKLVAAKEGSMQVLYYGVRQEGRRSSPMNTSTAHLYFHMVKW